MSANTKIEWADHTFNPWLGCTKISPACDHCYAESWAKRSGLVKWGVHEPRRRTSVHNWQQPLRWQRQAQQQGIRYRVFCASLLACTQYGNYPYWLPCVIISKNITPQGRHHASHQPHRYENRHGDQAVGRAGSCCRWHELERLSP
ncbi:DUF5131 family protein [Paralysiella testudinis]|uniref:DUF5131 family protein n=1 Tax=Paralysiella testudinis TaxID=2809020 RepID=A0A892ZMD9_9NEIS|nr:DUF5131 family protein [Paralysiella testudinis]QRQ82866.1 DUF5131 family protein [Paralysiella testudinis]